MKQISTFIVKNRIAIIVALAVTIGWLYTWYMYSNGEFGQ